MILKEGLARHLLSEAITLIGKEYQRKRLAFIREGLNGAPFETAEKLVELEDDRERMVKELTERWEERIEEIQRGYYHDDWDDCYGAATEIKMMGSESPHYEDHIATIVDSGLPLLGKAYILTCRGRMSYKRAKEVLGELPPGWNEDDEYGEDEDEDEDEEDCAEETGGVPTDITKNPFHDLYDGKAPPKPK